MSKPFFVTDGISLKTMAQPNGIDTENYKGKLRKRYASQYNEPDTLRPLENKNDKLPENESETVVLQQKDIDSDSNSGDPGVVTVSTQTTDDVPVISMKDFEIVDMEDKMNLLMSAINKVNTSFHLKIDSMEKKLKSNWDAALPRVKAVEKDVQELQVRVKDMESLRPGIAESQRLILDLSNKIENLTDDMATLKGLVQVQEREILDLKKKSIDLTAHSMANNIVITGVLGDSEKEKDCKSKIVNLLKTHMDLEISDKDIEVAHRLGKYKEGMN